MTAAPLSMYRLLPPLTEGVRSIVVDDGPLIRWQTRGDPAELPTRVTAQWQGPPSFREIDYPSSSLGAPVLIRRVAGTVRERIAPGGRFPPVSVSGEPEGKDELYVAEHLADCLDPDRSSAPLQPTLVIEKAVFLPDKLPLVRGSSSARLPARGLLERLGGRCALRSHRQGRAGAAPGLVDGFRTRRPHCNPMGI